MTPTPFVALSRFSVANDMAENVAQAFHKRPHMVDKAKGFLRMDVIRPHKDPQEFWLITYWQDEMCFRAWHKGHTYKDSHAGIPKGLKLNPAKTSITFFDLVTS